MNETPTLIAQDFQDRSTSLKVFGILEILLGALFALFTPLMIVGMMAGPPEADAGAPSAKLMLPGLLMYPTLSALFITLGIGAIRCRRWARALSLVFAVVWLVTGVVGFCFALAFMPQVLKAATAPGNPTPPPGFVAGMFAVMIVIWTVMFLAIPGVLTLYFRSPHVKATCEARDPQPSWTDACPLPVLGLSLLVGFGALFMLLMPVVYNGVLPFFGMLLSGLGGGAVIVVMAGVIAWCARGLYQLKSAAWWTVLVLTCATLVSNVLTFANVDMADMFRLMGYTEAQIKLMEQSPVSGRGTMALWSVGSMALFVGYLVYLKRYFRRS